MKDRPLSWCEFIESLPSKAPHKHVFRVANWLLINAAFHVRCSGPFRFLDAIKGLAIVIAVVLFIIELHTMREEREARTLSSVSQAYEILQDVVEQSDNRTSGEKRSRRQMIASESLHKHSKIDDGKYLAGLYAPDVSFHLTRNTYYSGCEEKQDTRRVVLKGAYFDRANLKESEFKVANLSGSHFLFANLSGSNFYYACLVGANLRFAILSDSILGFANLAGADLSHTELDGATMDGTNLSNVNFDEVKGLKQEQLDQACIPPGSLPPFNLPRGLKIPPATEDCPVVQAQ